MSISILKLPVKNLMLSIGPLNAMPFANKLQTVKIVSKIAKLVPNPTVQAVAHTVEAGIKVVEQIQTQAQEKELAAVMSMQTSSSPK